MEPCNGMYEMGVSGRMKQYIVFMLKTLLYLTLPQTLTISATSVVLLCAVSWSGCSCLNCHKNVS